jgi:hypothetical protein
VVDPMCGIGTTLVEAVHAGRDALSKAAARISPAAATAQTAAGSGSRSLAMAASPSFCAMRPRGSSMR